MPAGATYEPITSTTLASAQSTITFSSISSSYTDLRLVFFMAALGSNERPLLRLNNNSSSIYTLTRLQGIGSAVQSSNEATSTGFDFNSGANANANIPSLYIFDMLSYLAAVNKTVLCQHSEDLSGSGRTARYVGLFASTATISRIDITNAFGGNLAAGTIATLYGIKAA